MKPTLFKCKHILSAGCALGAALLAGCAGANSMEKTITLKTMGSLYFGGTVTKLDNGETFHGDHGYAQYFIPAKSRNYPLIMWHGIGQSGRSYESTPDGREGFMAILPRRDWPVYIIDQPRRGRAGRTLATEVTHAVPTTMRESSAWNAFRNGIWEPPKAPYCYSGTQFPHDPASVDQFFRQQTPDTGAEPRTSDYYRFMGNTMAELLKQTGPAVLITHSNRGKVFDPPAGTEDAGRNMQPIRVPEEEFRKLAKIPILIVYGDNIATEPSTIFNVNIWRLSSIRAKQFADAVNRRGGDVRVIRLPELGIRGNTHAPFADRNNLEIADLLERYLHEKGLDGRDRPHPGPARKAVSQYTIPLQNANTQQK